MTNLTVLSAGLHNDTRACHSDGTDMFIDTDIYFRDELRIFSKRLAFAGNPWCFAICTNCFQECIYCFANVEDDSRNVPKRLRETVIHVLIKIDLTAALCPRCGNLIK